MSLRAAQKLQAEGIDCHVVDLCWINPLPEKLIIESATKTGAVLVVDECRKSGGMAEPILALIAENCRNVRCHQITGLDTYIPLGGAANKVLIQEEDIERAARGVNSGAQ